MTSEDILVTLKAVLAALPSAAPSATQKVMLFNNDGTPAGQWPAQQLMQDMAKAGVGYGTCSTAATTAAKVVAITDFILLKNGLVTVFFNNAVNVVNATLNVNNTGAKDIYVNGAALQPGVIRPRTTVMLQYDGTRFNVVNMSGLEESDSPDALWVDLGLPSGLKWATRNIDVTKANGFADSPTGWGSYFSWGNTEGHPEGSGYDFGSSNDGPYASTPGAALNGNIAPSQDAARANCKAPWRMPTSAEFQELYDNCNCEWVSDYQGSGVAGRVFTSKINGKVVFFPASGHYNGTTLSNRGSRGYYWASPLYSSSTGRSLYFSASDVLPQNDNYRFLGFSVRPVQ